MNKKQRWLQAVEVEKFKIKEKIEDTRKMIDLLTENEQYALIGQYGIILSELHDDLYFIEQHGFSRPTLAEKATNKHT